MDCRYRPGPTFLQCCCTTESIKGAHSKKKAPDGLNGAKYVAATLPSECDDVINVAHVSIIRR